MSSGSSSGHFSPTHAAGPDTSTAAIINIFRRPTASFDRALQPLAMRRFEVALVCFNLDVRREPLRASECAVLGVK